MHVHTNYIHIFMKFRASDDESKRKQLLAVCSSRDPRSRMRENVCAVRGRKNYKNNGKTNTRFGELWTNEEEREEEEEEKEIQSEMIC